MLLIFSFAIINFPHLDSTSIPAVPAHGVYVALILYYARACSLYSDFLQRCHLLSTKLLSPKFSKNRLILSFKSFRKWRGMIQE